MKLHSCIKPVWKHNCDRCKYTGTVWTGENVEDWYTCGDTVLARFSDDGPDYWSMDRNIVMNYAADGFVTDVSSVHGRAKYALQGRLMVARYMLDNYDDVDDGYYPLDEDGVCRIAAVVRRLYTENRMTAGAMRNAAQMLHALLDRMGAKDAIHTPHASYDAQVR